MVSALYSRSCPIKKDSHRRAAWLCACYRPLRGEWRTCTESHAYHLPPAGGLQLVLEIEAIALGRQDCCTRLKSQNNDSGRAVGRATKGFRQPPFRGRVLMKSETRSPLSFYVVPHALMRPPVVCLSAPHCWVKAEHEENASQRHSTGRATGRSG